MARMTRRDYVRPIIGEVIERVGTGDMKALRKALREAYPWGQRKYHPHKIWLDEIRVQLGKKSFRPAYKVPECKGQKSLFT